MSSPVRLSVLLVAVLVLNSCRTVQRPAAASPSTGKAALEQLLRWEQQRSLGQGELLRWAEGSGEAAVRARAYLALARIQDPSTIPSVEKGLADSAPGPRQMAAFAAGVLGLSLEPLPAGLRDGLAAAVCRAEEKEVEPGVRRALLEALGRIQSPTAVARLVTRVGEAAPVDSVPARGAAAARVRTPSDAAAGHEAMARWEGAATAAALALGVAAKRDGTFPAGALPGLGALIRREASPVSRYAGAYALAMSKLKVARPWLLQCTEDIDPEVRAVCIRGLAEVGELADAPRLATKLEDPDSRVAVEATRTLARLSARCSEGSCGPLLALNALELEADRLLRKDLAGGGQPLLALAQQGLPAAGKPLLERLRARLSAGLRPPGNSTATANLDCRLAAAIDRIEGGLQHVLHCGGGQVSEAQRLWLGLSELVKAEPRVLTAKPQPWSTWLAHPQPRVVAAAIELLAHTAPPGAVLLLRPTLSHPDSVVVATGVGALATLKDRESIPAVLERARALPEDSQLIPSYADALAELGALEAVPELKHWLRSSQPATSLAAALALSRLTRSEVKPERVEGSLPPFQRAGAMTPTSPRPRWLINTERGELEVELFSDEAPVTVASLEALMERGFYAQLTFHRVVPDFVVQGGDPRGDGEGGPPYRLRCEVTPRAYERGVLGMALSGKDTGGSQFFVASSAQPHLNGHYTAFGRVTRGMEVVDRLLEGDRILGTRRLPLGP